MATIYNSELQKEIAKGAKLQQAVDAIPSKLSDIVVPVMEVNPKILKNVNYSMDGTLTSATSSTISTLPSNRDFYLTNAHIGYYKDASATSTKFTLTVVINGAETVLLTLNGIPTTAQNNEIVISLNTPIKLDRGSLIRLRSSTAVANFTVYANVMGYLEQNSEA